MGRKKITQERQKQIFIGLFNAIAKNGFANCTITEISQQAGLSRGILHYYFKNKQEMQLEFMKSLGNTHYEGLLWLISGMEDAREKIRSVIRFHFLDESKAFNDMVRVWVEFWGQSPHDRQVREVIRTIQQRLRGLIAGIIEEGMEKGLFRKVDPVGTASMIMGLIEGLTLQKSVDWKSLGFDEISRSIDAFIFYFLDQAGTGTEFPPDANL
jgi:AcrR family transcriptional regulator